MFGDSPLLVFVVTDKLELDELLWAVPNIAFKRDDSDELLLWFLLNILGYDDGDKGGVLDLLDDAVDSIIEDGLDGIFNLILDMFLFGTDPPDEFDPLEFVCRC